MKRVWNPSSSNSDAGYIQGDLKVAIWANKAFQSGYTSCLDQYAFSGQVVQFDELVYSASTVQCLSFVVEPVEKVQQSTFNS